MEGVGPLEGVGQALEAPTEVVHLIEQGASPTESVERDACLGQIDGLAAIRGVGGVGEAEVAGVAGIAPAGLAGLGREADERRDRRIDRAVQVRDDRPERRPSLALEGRLGVAGETLIRRVLVAAADDRTDHGHPVHQAGESGHVLAEVDAGHVRRNRLELAADLGGGVRLEVHHVLVRWPAGQKDHDDRLVLQATPRRRLGLGGEQLRQAQAAKCQAADLQEIAPRDAVAVAAVGRSADGQHQSLPVRTDITVV